MFGTPTKLLILCESTLLVRTLEASYSGAFLMYFRHIVSLLSTSDQPAAKATTYTGQHNMEKRGQTFIP